MPNLISNGKFSNGLKKVGSDYNYVNPDPSYHTVAGDYSVIANPGTQFQNGYDSYGDHTSGSGMMLFVDGSTTGSDFWSQTVKLTAGETYKFTYFVTAADGSNLPEIATTLDGAAVGASFQVTAEGGGANWQKVTETFVATSGGRHVLAMHDVNTAAFGNDFTIDDLKLVVIHPSAAPALEPAHYYDSLLALHPVGHLTIA